MAHKKPAFDAVELSRRLRERSGRQLFSMSPSQRLAFLNRRFQEWKANHTDQKTEDKPAAMAEPVVH